MHDLEAAARQNGLHNLQRQEEKKRERDMHDLGAAARQNGLHNLQRQGPKKKNHNLTRIMRTNLTCNNSCKISYCKIA
jgi:hypothetical protein